MRFLIRYFLIIHGAIMHILILLLVDSIQSFRYERRMREA